MDAADESGLLRLRDCEMGENSRNAPQSWRWAGSKRRGSVTIFFKVSCRRSSPSPPHLSHQTSSFAAVCLFAYSAVTPAAYVLHMKGRELSLLLFSLRGSHSRSLSSRTDNKNTRRRHVLLSSGTAAGTGRANHYAGTHPPTRASKLFTWPSRRACATTRRRRRRPRRAPPRCA